MHLVGSLPDVDDNQTIASACDFTVNPMSTTVHRRMSKNKSRGMNSAMLSITDDTASNLPNHLLHYNRESVRSINHANLAR